MRETEHHSRWTGTAGNSQPALTWFVIAAVRPWILRTYDRGSLGAPSVSRNELSLRMRPANWMTRIGQR
jgi:hypothetical protein